MINSTNQLKRGKRRKQETCIKHAETQLKIRWLQGHAPGHPKALEAVKSLGIQRAMELFKAWPCFVSWPFCSCAIITMPSCSPSRRL